MASLLITPDLGASTKDNYTLFGY